MAFKMKGPTFFGKSMKKSSSPAKHSGAEYKKEVKEKDNVNVRPQDVRGHDEGHRTKWDENHNDIDKSPNKQFDVTPRREKAKLDYDKLTTDGDYVKPRREKAKTQKRKTGAKELTPEMKKKMMEKKKGYTKKEMMKKLAKEKAASPTKHKDTDAEYEAMRKRPADQQTIGGPGRGKKGHKHPHSGRSGAHSGTWVSQDKFESDEKSKKRDESDIWKRDDTASPNKQTSFGDKLKAGYHALRENIGKVHGHGSTDSLSHNISRSYKKKKKEYRDAKKSPRTTNRVVKGIGGASKLKRGYVKH